MILVGDGIHNFVDGILVAAAFLTDPKLGLMTSLAIFAHEIPQEVGDFIVLLNAGFSRTRAYVYNLICSLMAVVGGIVGYFALASSSTLIPFALVLASSGFIYIAACDLMPQMHHREAAEVAYFGAKVLHPRALIPLDGSRIELHVRSFVELTNRPAGR